MEEKKSWKGAIPIISAVIGLIIGILIMFFISGCGVSLPKKLNGEPWTCYYYKWTVYGLQKKPDQSNIVRIQDDCRSLSKELDCKEYKIGCAKKKTE